MNSKRWLSGALFVATLLIAAWMWNDRSAGPGVPEAPPTAMPAQASRPAAPAALPPAPALPAMPTRELDLPLADQVERLLATQDPKDAYTAYLLLASCVIVNDTHDLKFYDSTLRTSRAMTAAERQQVTAWCSGMTERERQARLDHLAIAARGGVAGAAWTFFAEGPFGDPSALQTRPDDPLVREWKATAAAQLAQAAEAGDETTLLLWGFKNLKADGTLDTDPALGYGYLLAYGLIAPDRILGGTPAAQQYAEGSNLMKALGGALSPEQRAAAMAAAQRIAAKVKAKRQRAGDQQGG